MSKTGKWHFTIPYPQGDPSLPVELVCPDGTISGITLRTSRNGWGQFQERKRHEMEHRLLTLLNKEPGDESP